MKNQHGFTIIELTVVMFILTGLLAFTTPSLRQYNNNRLTETNIDEINHIIDASQNYQFDRLAWPDEANNCANLIGELTSQGFLNNIDITNPFNNNYQFSCTSQLLTIVNVADDNDWAQTISGALPATTVAGVNSTTIIPRSGAIPAIVNKLDRNGTDGGMTANLDMNTNSITDVTNIQTTQINGKSVTDYETPSLQVSFFQLGTCPAGWAYYSGAAGRTLVGAGFSDTNYGYLSAGGASVVGLSIAQMPRHQHGSGWGEEARFGSYHGLSGRGGLGSGSTDHNNSESLTSAVGSGAAHENRMPYRTLMPCYKL